MLQHSVGRRRMRRKEGGCERKKQREGGRESSMQWEKLEIAERQVAFDEEVENEKNV